MKNKRELDQAAGLRQKMNRPKTPQVLAVTGGKGGVGKTNVSVNLSIALACMGQSVMLLDADLGLANVDVLLGIHPQHTIADVFAGQCDLADTIVTGPCGIQIIPSASGLQEMSERGVQDHAGLVQAFNQMTCDIDTLIIDTAAGISDSVVSFSRAAQEVLVVVCDEPTSITDAYALIKLLSNEYDVRRFRVLANMVKDNIQGERLFEKLMTATDRFLDVTLQYVGAVPFDPFVRRAVRRQKAVVEMYPQSPAAMSFYDLAHQVEKWSLPAVASGQISFFMNQLVQPLVEKGEIA